jgi:hypothetical protein
VLVSFCAVLVLYEAETATDMILNALALFFVLTVDNKLVTGSMLDELRETQESELFTSESTHVRALWASAPSHPNTMATYQNFHPAVTRGVGIFNMGVLALGGVCFVAAAAAIRSSTM